MSAELPNHGSQRMQGDTAESARGSIELAATLLLLDEVMAKMSDAYIAIDESFRILDVNATTQRLVGRTKAELLGKDYFTVWPEVDESNSQHGDKLRAAMVNRQPCNFIDYFPALQLWTDVNLYPLTSGGYSIFLRDISEIKKNESAYRESNDHLNEVLDNMSDAFLAIDFNFIITKANKMALQKVGKPKAEVLGQSFFTIWDDTESQASSHVQMVRGAMADRRSRQYLEFFPPLDQYTDIILHPTTNGGISCFYHDVTQRKRLEMTLEASNREKEVLLVEIHHRVKNNLAIVSSLLQLQAQRTEHAQSKHLIMQSEARVRAMALIHQTLYQQHNFAEVDIAAYIEKLVTELQNVYQLPDQNVLIDLTLAQVQMDITQAVPFGLILAELIGNTFKHAFRERPTGVLAITLALTDRSVSLLVQDDGPGMNLSLAHAKGGLGMNLIYGLSQQLNGTLDVHTDGYTKIKLVFTLDTDGREASA